MARPRQISDARILEVARTVFLSEGAGVSTTTIADRIGISQSVLFQRFGTKEGLLIAALAPDRDMSWLELIRRGPDQREIAVQLMELARAITGAFRQMLPALTVLRQAGLDLHDIVREGEAPAPIALHLELTTWFRRAQRQGRIRRGDHAAMALAFQGALQIKPYLSYVVETPVGEEEIAYLRSVVEAFWWGLSVDRLAAAESGDTEPVCPPGC